MAPQIAISKVNQEYGGSIYAMPLPYNGNPLSVGPSGLDPQAKSPVPGNDTAGSTSDPFGPMAIAIMLLGGAAGFAMSRRFNSGSSSGSSQPNEAPANTNNAASSSDGIPVIAEGAGYGDSGASSVVTVLQQLLTQQGYNVGPTGTDGYFGPATLQAVKAFQAANGLTVDGIVGPQTWTALAVATHGVPAQSDTTSTMAANNPTPPPGNTSESPASQARSGEAGSGTASAAKANDNEVPGWVPALATAGKDLNTVAAGAEAVGLAGDLGIVDEEYSLPATLIGGIGSLVGGGAEVIAGLEEYTHGEQSQGKAEMISGAVSGVTGGVGLAAKWFKAAAPVIESKGTNLATDLGDAAPSVSADGTSVATWLQNMVSKTEAAGTAAAQRLRNEASNLQDVNPDAADGLRTTANVVATATNIAATAGKAVASGVEDASNSIASGLKIASSAVKKAVTFISNTVSAAGNYLDNTYVKAAAWATHGVNDLLGWLHGN